MGSHSTSGLQSESVALPGPTPAANIPPPPHPVQSAAISLRAEQTQSAPVTAPTDQSAQSAPISAPTDHSAQSAPVSEPADQSAQSGPVGGPADQSVQSGPVSGPDQSGLAPPELDQSGRGKHQPVKCKLDACIALQFKEAEEKEAKDRERLLKRKARNIVQEEEGSKGKCQRIN